MQHFILVGMHKNKIRDSLSKVYALRSAMALHGWDQETYMPPGGGGNRARILAELGAVMHQEMTGPSLIESLHAESSQHPESSDPWGSCVRAYLRDCERKAKIPTSLDRELNESCSLTQQAWAGSRKTGQSHEFVRRLDHLIELKRQEVLCLEQEGLKGYDVLMDSFEPGARVAQLDPLFDNLHQGLQAILAQIPLSHTSIPSPFSPTAHFPVAAQQAYSQDLLKRMGFDFSKGRLDLSAHPFTEGIAPADVRLTTRYTEQDFLDSFFTVLHEGGHGLYEQGFEEKWYWTPLAEAVSLGVHESQSRFWENCVGRSHDFWVGEWPHAQRFFPEALAQSSVESIVAQAQKVSRSFIRVESDEVTYNLHIMLRYRLERALFSGDLQTSDLEQAWNQESLHLLGLTPKTPQEGYLQDVHWSAGLFGYFPTYTLGNLYAAQLHQHLLNIMPELPSQLRQGQLAPVLQWLRTHIHSHGRRYNVTDLMQHAIGAPLDESIFLNYLRQRYLV